MIENPEGGDDLIKLNWNSDPEIVDPSKYIEAWLIFLKNFIFFITKIYF